MDVTHERSMARRWLMLLLGLLAPLALEWGLRSVREVPYVRPLIQHIAASGINAGGYYYTEIEETAEADVHMRSVFGRR